MFTDATPESKPVQIVADYPAAFLVAQRCIGNAPIVLVDSFQAFYAHTQHFIQSKSTWHTEQTWFQYAVALAVVPEDEPLIVVAKGDVFDFRSVNFLHCVFERCWSRIPRMAIGSDHCIISGGSNGSAGNRIRSNVPDGRVSIRIGRVTELRRLAGLPFAFSIGKISVPLYHCDTPLFMSW